MASQIKVNEIIKQSGSSISIGESGDTITLRTINWQRLLTFLIILLRFSAYYQVLIQLFLTTHGLN